MKKKDYQQDDVYAWCHNYTYKVDTQFLDLNTCNLIVQDTHRAFGLDTIYEVPVVQGSVGKLKSYYRRSDNVIRLIEEMRFRPILLHEAAHSLNRYFYGTQSVSHGPEFVGFNMILLNKWSKIPMSELIRTAEMNGLEYRMDIKPERNFRARPILTNPVPQDSIKLAKGYLQGYTYREPNEKGGYKLVYAVD